MGELAKTSYKKSHTTATTRESSEYNRDIRRDVIRSRRYVAHIGDENAIYTIGPLCVTTHGDKGNPTGFS